MVFKHNLFSKFHCCKLLLKEISGSSCFGKSNIITIIPSENQDLQFREYEKYSPHH